MTFLKLAGPFQVPRGPLERCRPAALRAALGAGAEVVTAAGAQAAEPPAACAQPTRTPCGRQCAEKRDEQPHRQDYQIAFRQRAWAGLGRERRVQEVVEL